jgi:ABC-2 type transport system ATP-binding protein
MNNRDELVIQTHGIARSYGAIHALKPLDLEVPKNSIFAFLGPNGAGKTTTIKLLLGLIRPTSGSGTIFGKDIVRDSVDIRASVGYLPQDLRSYDHMSARETLDYTAKFFFSGPQSEIDRRVDELLDLVGLSDKADRPIKSFSGGERQRLGIAQAEVNYPELLILDEPAASLDPMGRRDVLEIVSRIRARSTIFYCTHILDDVQRISDQVAILNNGEMVTHGPLEAVLKDRGGSVFSVTLSGATDRAYQSVLGLPWVSGIERRQNGDQARWEIAVRDEGRASDDLLAHLVSSGVRVSDFGLKRVHLEDIFVDVVEGAKK